MRINGLQRIGLVLSALWALGAALRERGKQVDYAKDLFQSQYGECLNRANSMINCDNISYQAAMDSTANWADVAFFAFGPVIAGWLVALITMRTFRWVSDGFSKKNY
jgi:hypothetical protein